MTYPSAKRYIGFATQTGIGVPATTPTLFIPHVANQSKFKWNRNAQDEKYQTGDLFVLVDSIAVKPMASGVIVCPFKPSVLNPLLANCCYANGDIIPPVYSTFFIGDGLNEKIYSDVLCTQAKMNVVDDDNAALWTLNFLGLSVPVPHAVRTATLPTYEKSYRMPDLQPATFMGVAAVNGFESLTWTLDAGSTAYYGSKGDNTDGPSEIIVNELNGTVDGVMAYISDAYRLAYVNACGNFGNYAFEFKSTCGTAHSHIFGLPNGTIVDDEENAPDNLVINETFSVKGVRQTSGTGATATIAIDTDIV